jgi:hypothetical protein
MRRPFSALVTSVCLLLLSAGVALAAPPGNDAIADATVIGTIPYTDTIDTSEATTSPDDPECFGQGPTVWYVYTAPVDQRLLADTFGSSYDTTLSVYTGSPGSLEQIACNDDAGSGVQSALILEASAGTTYYLMVGSFADSPGGTLVFSLAETDLVTPEMNITVDARATVDTRSGTVTVTGTATCTGAEDGFVEVSLEQRVGRFIIRGFGGTFVECDGAPQDWSVEVVGETGLFKGGKAVAFAFGEACGIFNCAFDFEQQNVSLRR